MLGVVIMVIHPIFAWESIGIIFVLDVVRRCIICMDLYGTYYIIV